MRLGQEVRDSRTSRQIWQVWLAENTERKPCSEIRVRPEVAILGADQKERGLWGREWRHQEESNPGRPHGKLITTAPPKPAGSFRKFLSIYRVTLTIIRKANHKQANRSAIETNRNAF